MILETADLTVTSGREAAMREAVPLFPGSQGRREVRLHPLVETPGLYRLLADWETPEDHRVQVRGPDAFAQWRALASPHFAAPPAVTHSEEALSSPGG